MKAIGNPDGKETAVSGPTAKKVRLPLSTSNLGLPIALIVTVIIFSVLAPTTFPTVGDVQSIVDSQVTTLLLAITICFPLRCGDFDLSVAPAMIVAGAICVRLSSAGVSAVLAIILA